MMKKNLILMSENFCGSNGFRNFYMNGVDVLKNGDLSCSFFISVILVACKFINGVSFTVTGLIHRIEESNLFEEITIDSPEEIQEADIIIWEPLKDNGNKHVGIYVGNGFAISNRSSQGSPGKHPIIYTGLDKGEPKKATIQTIYRIKKEV